MKMLEPEIRVGIITAGEPEITTGDGCFYVNNLLIGNGFHWQKRMRAKMRGHLESIGRADNHIHAVNVLPVEDYLLSVIGSEMNPGAPLEFLKAHAVISRSWALRKLTGNDHCSCGRCHEGDMIVDWEESDCHIGFDVCSDDHCQRYQGLPEIVTQAAAEAISATRGEVLADVDGNIADARFSKCCGGITERFSSCWADIDFDYLPVKSDPWCDLSDMSADDKNIFLSTVLKDYDLQIQDFYDWSSEISKDRLRVKVREIYGFDIGEIREMSAEKRGGSGRITLLRLVGSDRTLLIGKELPIRRLLSESCLYSSWFEIEDSGDVFTLHGRGWGHGVGLCQIGAARMACEGKDYKEILEYYYPATQLIKKYE